MLPRLQLTSSQNSPIEFPHRSNGFAATADVPVMDMEMRQKLRMIKDVPLYGLDMRLIGAARRRSAQGGGPNNSASLALLLSAPGMAMAGVLLHSMPKVLIEGIVRRTLGVQLYLPPTHEMALPNPIYADDGPGTYVAVMAICGRMGRFLTKGELGSLCDKIKRYIEAFETWQDCPDPARMTPGQRALLQFARDVDRTYYPAAAGGEPVFLSPGRLPKVRCLLAMFEAWRAAATGSKPIAQAPQYVGCAARSIAARSRSHAPPLTHPESNYTWWLTMSCLRHMRLAPDVLLIPATRNWEPQQLPIGEILVTCLADARVEDGGGFNAGQPGGTTDKIAKDPRDWARDRESAMERRSYLTDNLRESDESMQRRADVLESIPALSRDLYGLLGDIITLEAEARELPDPRSLGDGGAPPGEHPQIAKARLYLDFVEAVKNILGGGGDGASRTALGHDDG
ncbi:hypothetical protein DL768_009571 [Monosporascus sp. mg162]|nr:hypothetical protein DL768_009571 [Monosporascus sp. mg162]